MRLSLLLLLLAACPQPPEVAVPEAAPEAAPPEAAPRRASVPSTLPIPTPAFPAGPDTDGDGLSDRDERETYGSDPAKTDSDGDGEPDGKEVRVHGTDPTNPDTDGDRLLDGQEVTGSTDPLVADNPEPPPPPESPDGPKSPIDPYAAALAGSGDPPPELRCPADPTEGWPTTCWQRIERTAYLRGAQSADPEGAGYDPAAEPDEGPVRSVTVSAFWISAYEVSAAQYQRCVTAGACDRGAVGPGSTLHVAHTPRHPVTAITWEGAASYCRYLRARLPTEAQWELAARGVEGRRFPWGEAAEPGPASLVDLPAVARASPYGIRGMGGNAAEWVADHYTPDAYAHAPAVDPTGPTEGTRRVQRGGAWTSPEAVRSADRAAAPPTVQLPDVGFRCVRAASDGS